MENGRATIYRLIFENDEWGGMGINTEYPNVEQSMNSHSQFHIIIFVCVDVISSKPDATDGVSFAQRIVFHATARHCFMENIMHVRALAVIE